jgi:hypothetical protein
VSATLNCAQCAAPFDAPTQRRGARARRFCTPKCQQTAANARRQTTREGRKGNLSTAGDGSGQPLPSTLTNTPPSGSRALSDARNVSAARLARISALMTLAHSRGGIDPWQVAELAKLRNISPWAPLRVILGHKDGMK